MLCCLLAALRKPLAKLRAVKPAHLYSDMYSEIIATGSNQKLESVSQIPFNQLCQLCQRNFASTKPEQNFPFHNLEELETSTRFSCHICHILIENFRYTEEVYRKVVAPLLGRNVEAKLAPPLNLQVWVWRYRLTLQIRVAPVGNTTPINGHVSLRLSDHPGTS